MLAGPYLKPHLQSLFFWFRGESDALWILNQGLSIGCLNYRVPTKSRECHSWTLLNIEVSSEIRIVLDSLLAWPNLSTSSNYCGCIVAHRRMLKVFNTYFYTHLPFWIPLYSFLNIRTLAADCLKASIWWPRWKTWLIHCRYIKSFRNTSLFSAKSKRYRVQDLLQDIEFFLASSRNENWFFISGKGVVGEKEEKELKPKVEYSVFKEIPTTCQVINRWICGNWWGQGLIGFLYPTKWSTRSTTWKLGCSNIINGRSSSWERPILLLKNNPTAPLNKPYSFNTNSWGHCTNMANLTYD